MGFTFKKIPSYDLPEGDYRAKVSDVFDRSTGALRIVFQVTSLNHPVYVYSAGKNYAPGKSQLAEELVQWLGEKAVGGLVKIDGTIDTAKLKGLTADIRIEHIHNDDYDKPFAHISRIEQAGTFVTE